MSRSSKFVVAVEFGYQENVVLCALKRENFKDAASLIEYLDENLQELEAAAVKEATAKAENEDEEEIEAAASPTDSSVPPESTHHPLSLREETELFYRRSICLVCLKNKRSSVLLPCCHFALCETCRRKTSRCPEEDCGLLIEASIQTYTL